MDWERLVEQPLFVLRRSGRYLVVDLLEPHAVLSTSVRNGGQAGHVRYLVNHQSCEGAAHFARHDVITGAGQSPYHDIVCGEAGVPPDATAMMGTAANMRYAAVVQENDDRLTVAAIVTAGVHGNATAAGEPASWRETDAGIHKVPVYDGTINTMVLVNQALTPAALARSVVTMTEGKSAALQRLAVPSTRHVELATGTGTDQYCIAAPVAAEWTLTSASPHMKLGELVGSAVRRATMEALRWQNGLEPSSTRGVFHALGRYGVREATVFEEIAPLLSEADLELLRRNANAVFFEPLVGAAAHALAAVCDRVRHGTIPDSCAGDAKVQQAANLAANLAAQPHRWPEFRMKLQPHAAADVKTIVLHALALGWSEKWQTGH